MRKLGWLAVMGLLALAVPAQGRQAVEFGDFIVHYSAFTADFLHPPVAQAYGIKRSQNRAVLTITVQRKGDDGAQASEAQISASATNLHRQIQTLNMRQIREGEAIYYLADFPITDAEVLDFQVTVQPAGANEPYNLRFRQQFFTGTNS